MFRFRQNRAICPKQSKPLKPNIIRRQSQWLPHPMHPYAHICPDLPRPAHPCTHVIRGLDVAIACWYGIVGYPGQPLYYVYDEVKDPQDPYFGPFLGPFWDPPGQEGPTPGSPVRRLLMISAQITRTAQKCSKRGSQKCSKKWSFWDPPVRTPGWPSFWDHFLHHFLSNSMVTLILALR